jgi:peptidyl-prolyl cis-trans isomerase C
MKKVFLLFIILISCQKAKEDKSNWVASLGKEAVTKEELDNYLKKNLGEDPYNHTTVVLSELLDNLLTEKLLYWEAKKEGFTGGSQEEVIKSYIETICNKIKEPPENAVKEWYIKNKEKFKTGAQYYFWEIFITDRNKAESIYSSLKKGDDFHKILQENSENLNKENGGLIGPLSIEDIPEEIALSLSKLKKGEISPLLPVSGGYMILKLKEILPPKEISFEEAKGVILEILKEEMCEKELEKIKKTLILKETIWVYQKNLLFSYCGQFPLYMQ